VARKLHLTHPELKDILFCRISKFNLDYSININSKLFAPAEIKIMAGEKKDKFHA
jgi:hypothetical protein